MKISVIVPAFNEEKLIAATLESIRAATAAFTAIVEGYRVTAVGEVPPQTVKAIAEALRPLPEPTAALDRMSRP